MLAICLLVCPGLTDQPARAEPPTFGPYDVRSAFYVSKSENQNQVHYGVRVDEACRPQKERPVFGYWRRLKKGVRKDEPLEGPGRHLYGASDDQAVTPGSTGGVIRMFVKAAKKVKIEIRIEKTDAGCKATSYTTIQGTPARLTYAFLQLTRFGLGVKYVELVGTRASDGARVSEQVR
ncbi:MAG: DUF4833 domain-containing protein [Polyangiales bacterium]